MPVLACKCKVRPPSEGSYSLEGKAFIPEVMNVKKDYQLSFLLHSKKVGHGTRRLFSIEQMQRSHKSGTIARLEFDGSNLPMEAKKD